MEKLIEHTQYRKNEVLFAEGKIAHKIILIEKGNLMAYDTDNGTKKVHRFWFNQQPIFLTQCLIQKTATHQTVVALNDCSLMVINYNNLISHTENHPKLWELINLFISYENLMLHNYIALLTLQPKKRYQTFMQNHPELWQLLNADLLASYLNIGYSTFARFRQTR
jgi:CRP-like cAMP-binding protein